MSARGIQGASTVSPPLFTSIPRSAPHRNGLRQSLSYGIINHGGRRELSLDTAYLVGLGFSPTDNPPSPRNRRKDMNRIIGVCWIAFVGYLGVRLLVYIDGFYVTYGAWR